MNLAEQYRPRVWADVVGQDKALAKVRRLAARGLGGRAFWLSSPKGMGKTTIALLIASEIADTMNVREVDAGKLTGAAVRDLECEMGLFGMGRLTGRAYIVNEAHGLHKDAMRQLLVTLERLPRHVVVVFTTTTEAQMRLFEDKADAGPLLSRCVRLDLARRNVAEPFAERAKAIAQAEGLDGRPLAAYVRLAQHHRNDLRAMLESVEAGDMIG